MQLYETHEGDLA